MFPISDPELQLDLYRQHAEELEVGPSIMPSYAGLSPQKFEALTAYIASLN